MQLIMPPLTIAILGAPGSGKTSFIQKIVNQSNVDETRYEPTQNVTFATKKQTSKSGDLDLRLQDIPDTEKARQMATFLLNNCHISVLFFSLNDPNSFKRAMAIYQDLPTPKKGATSPTLLVGAKSDLPNSVSDEVITPFIEEKNIKFFPVSTKTGDGFPALMKEIAAHHPVVTKAFRPRSLPYAGLQLLTEDTGKQLRLKDVTKRYSKFWKSKDDVKNIRRVLANYCAYDAGRFAFFILAVTRHWNRHYIQQIRKVIKSIDSGNKDAQNIISQLDTIRSDRGKKFNRTGSLSRRLSFIKSKCPEKSTVDQDADELITANSCWRV